jgi:protocatechuate 3,4-dioxygenase, beta subunit
MHLFNRKSFERADEGRRRVLRMAALATLFTARPGAYADELTRTPEQGEGPFFPDRLPLDTDNDLLRITDATTPADGEVTWFSGAVLDAAGNPLRGALVEIWQCDAHGAYLHSQSGNAEKRDGHFQGYGRFLTGLSGEYGFRTIRPIPYPGRAPHIHVKVTRGDRHLLTSQCYVKGDQGNGRDGIFRSLSPTEAAAVVADFLPVEGSRIGELAARWDIVVGVTPEDG